MATPEQADFEERRNDIVGRYAVSNRDLKAGELIFSEKPFAYGPKNDSPPVCLGCYAYIDCTYLCSKCSWPVCNETCENIPAHKNAECEVFANAMAKFMNVQDPYAPCLQYECITPLRVLLAKEKHPDIWDKHVNCMEAHLNDRKEKEIWKFNTINIVGYLRGTCKCDRFSEDLIHQVCGLLDVNAFEARTISGNAIRCLYPKLSTFSHNCVSNVTHSIESNGEGNEEDFKVTLKASVSINKGEELCTSYTYSMWPTMARRAFLKESKYFDCNCQRCSDPTELGTHMSTLKCMKCDNGVILSTAPLLDPESEWKCTHCQHSLKGTTVQKVFKTIQEEIDQAEAMEQDASAIETKESLYRKYRSILHPRHAYFTILRISLAQMYGKVEGYTMDILPNILYERKIELCQNIMENINVLEPGYTRLRGTILYELHAPIIMLARNLYNVDVINKDELRSKLQEAIKLLKESSEILTLEPENSQEGMIGKMANQAYIQLSTNLEDLIDNI
ncbi:SET domain-containing protein SmydA-8-like [Onthophagus taurus]|uniref:SET domain-containing protein SmydA-8-like n=1 Tax=Onthophagus taurus TaxID=166361 RepID=UPI0039BEBA0F